MGENRKDWKHSTKTCACVTGGQPDNNWPLMLIWGWCQLFPRLSTEAGPSPTWSGGGILPILATTSLSGTRKRYLANFENMDWRLWRVCCVLPSLNTDVLPERCDGSLCFSDQSRACLRERMVPTEQTAVKDCQHKWAGVFNFQVQHLANIYWASVSCMFDQRWILDAVSATEWHSAWSYVSWDADVMMLLQSETFFLIMSSSELWERGN